MMPEGVFHASCVDWQGAGVLIVGESGSGKSSLALQLMAFGASLVSDDRVLVSLEAGHLVARAPATIIGLVEARGVGILRATPVEQTRLALVVDLDKSERDRLPEMHHYQLCDQTLPCLHRVEAPHFAASILQTLKAGRQTPDD